MSTPASIIGLIAIILVKEITSLSCGICQPRNSLFSDKSKPENSLSTINRPSLNTFIDGEATSLKLTADGILHQFINSSEVWNSASIKGVSIKGYEMVMQTDGNLVIYNNDTGKATWHTNTWIRPSSSNQIGPYCTTLQSDYNLILYDATCKVLWSRLPISDVPVASSCNKCSQSTSLFSGEGAFSRHSLKSNPSIIQNTLLNANYSLGLTSTGVILEQQTNSVGWSFNSPSTISNQGYELTMQSDGNLVVYNMDNGIATWHTRTYNVGVGPFCANLEVDGNLIVYDSICTSLWAYSPPAVPTTSTTAIPISTTKSVNPTSFSPKLDDINEHCNNCSPIIADGTPCNVVTSKLQCSGLKFAQCAPAESKNGQYDGIYINRICAPGTSCMPFPSLEILCQWNDRNPYYKI